MLLHYLKVAVRNLLKYKVHSLISVICLAIGITFFTSMHFFLDRFNSFNRLPDAERRISIRLDIDDGRDFLDSDDLQRLEETQIEGLGKLAAFGANFPRNMEVCFIGKEQEEKPFKVRTKAVNGNYFSHYNIHLLNGDIRFWGNDEVVINEDLAQKVYGSENPIGMSLRLETEYPNITLNNFKVVGIIKSDSPYAKETEVFFPLSITNKAVLIVESILKEDVSVHALNERLAQISSGNKGVYMAYLPRDRSQQEIAILLGYFISSLILISGLVSFLKFIIQMFYNRQRELALRKCVGSDMKGIFCLLFAECFCILSVALLLSMVLTELLYVAIGRELLVVAELYIQLSDMYWVNLWIYLIVLVACMLIILYPIWKLRKISVIHMVWVGNKRHWFRNSMIGLQMAISLFFVGSTIAILLIMDEGMERTPVYLSEAEEEHTFVVTSTTQRMHHHMEAILSEIERLPEIVEQLALPRTFEGTQRMEYISKQGSHYISVLEAPTSYFQFFRIPMEGRLVDEQSENMIYVSRIFYEQLQKEGIDGMVRLGGTEYQIAGVYENLYMETNEVKRSFGSALRPSSRASYYYFRASSSVNMDDVMDKVDAICRKYVPETLPLDNYRITDKTKTIQGMQDMICYAIMALSVISLIIVSLSIYSAISMDTVSRQKEVAIRKINGATPKVIAWMFGRIYILLYLITFIAIYPLLRLLMILLTDGESESVSRWDWPIGLFIGIGLFIFMVTAYKIYRIMHINPASIIKKE